MTDSNDLILFSKRDADGVAIIEERLLRNRSAQMPSFDEIKRDAANVLIRETIIKFLPHEFSEATTKIVLEFLPKVDNFSIPFTTKRRMLHFVWSM